MKRFFACAASLLVLSTLFSCKEEKKSPEVNVSVNESVYKWYYFDQNGIQTAEKIKDVPAVPFKPWTEAVRLSSLSEAQGKGFGVLNRQGIVVFDSKDFSLYSDLNLFKNKTAGNLFFYKDIPFFSVYKSSFFGESKQKINVPEAMHSFLIQFDPSTNINYPVINVSNLGFDENTEVTDFVFDGRMITCSAKSMQNEKIEFFYKNIQLKEDFLLVTPENASSLLFITESNAEKFRGIRKTESFGKAPERIKRLLKSIPENIGLSVQVFTSGGHSPRTFELRPESESFIKAQCILSEFWAGALFEDGTFYLNGALPDHKMLNDGKTVALRLPVLPDGFIYSGFTLSGTSLYASWEEGSFYETGRSGFIKLDLEQVLYKRDI